MYVKIVITEWLLVTTPCIVIINIIIHIILINITTIYT